MQEFVMAIEKYKELAVQKIKMANDCRETEQIIQTILELADKSNLPSNAIGLKERLQQLSSAGIDYLHWCNIQCAILYLEKKIKNTIENDQRRN